MTEHPITPPPELVEQWIKSARYREFMPYPEGYEQYEQRLTTIAARWGADQELEACCDWLEDVICDDPQDTAKELRAARRPKPPSLKERALEGLTRLVATGEFFSDQMKDLDTIRRALEALPND
jgi:hypothetical protein